MVININKKSIFMMYLGKKKAPIKTYFIDSSEFSCTLNQLYP